MRFTIEQVQTVIYLSSVDAASLLKIAEHASNLIPGLSGVDPVILPKQLEAIVELPRIQMKNDDTGWAFNFAPIRCDFFYTPLQRPEVTKLHDILTMVEEPVLSFWSALENNLAARSHRLALVITLADEIENAGEEIRRRFVNSRYGEGAKEIQLNYRLTLIKENFSLNQWVRIRNREAQPGMSEALYMLIDINTVVEKPLERVDTATIKLFLKTASYLVLENVNFHSENA